MYNIYKKKSTENNTKEVYLIWVQEVAGSNPVFPQKYNLYFKAGLIIKKDNIKKIKNNLKDVKDYILFFKNINNLYLRKNKNLIKVLLKKKELIELYRYFKKKYKIYIKKMIYENNMIKCIIKIKKNISIKKNNDLKRRKFFSKIF